MTLHTSDVPHASDAPAAATPALRAIPRVVNITFGEFRRDFLATSTPVIVSGSLDGWPRRGRLSLDRIVEVCGGRSIYPPCAREKVVVHAPKIASKRWGGLWSIPPNERLQNFSDLIAAQQDDGWAGELLEEGAGADRRVDVRGAELYLFDAPIAIFCPALLAELRAPRYFPVDFLRQLGEYGPEADDCVLADECCAYPRPHPSLFVGRASARSGLHIDSRATRFWMAVHAGAKEFRLLDRAASLRLHADRPTECFSSASAAMAAKNRKPKPHLLTEVCPGVDGDLFAGGRADVWSGRVAEGDIIFIPEFWAHQVQNLESPTIAVSYNFLDDFALRAHELLFLDMLDMLAANATGAAGLPPIEKLLEHIRRLGLAAEAGFPTATLAATPADAGDTPWKAWYERNRPAAGAATEEALNEWASGGGAGRMFARLKGEPTLRSGWM